MTLSWKDIEEKQIDFDTLMYFEVKAQDLLSLQSDVNKWVLVAKCKPMHALQMLPWKANPFTDLHGDLADVIALKASSKDLKTMGVTYKQLVENGMSHETMRLMSLSLQSWIDLGFSLQDMETFTDVHLSRVFNMTRMSLAACFK